jgi:hypothetical protein
VAEKGGEEKTRESGDDREDNSDEYFFVSAYFISYAILEKEFLFQFYQVTEGPVENGKFFLCYFI